jgi:hypothetical protein
MALIGASALPRLIGAWQRSRAIMHAQCAGPKRGTDVITIRNGSSTITKVSESGVMDDGHVMCLGCS